MGGKIKNRLLFSRKIYTLVILVSYDANRGNVAIIVWNTLEAPYVWDVKSTEYEGTINLGNSTRSLLSIYFRDYVYTDTDTEKEYFKEATVVTVAAAPSMDKDLGSRQIVLDPTDSKEFVKFEDDFETSAPRKNEEEATWFKDRKITAYVPENVCEDLEALYGKEVTVIFGRDNVVAAIMVTNDAFIDNELVEKVDLADSKITVAGKAYKIDTGAEVYVNGIAFGTGKAQVAKVLTKIGANPDSTRSLTKALKANVILNNKNKVERIDFTISGEYYIDADTDAFVTSSDDYEYEIQQYVVEKIKTKGDVVAVGSASAIYNYKDIIEDEDEPKVIRDSKAIQLDEIKVGDVLTIVYEDSDIRTIYVSSEKAEGEAKVKSTLDVTVDGTKYLANALATLTATGELKEATTDVNYTELKKIDGEEVTLYLNILGEYVALVADSSAADGLFGVVTNVNSIQEDKDNDYAEYRSIRIMLPDGEVSRYTVSYDDKNDTTKGAENHKLSAASSLLNKLITFKCDGNNNILIDDIYVAEEDTEGKVDNVDGKVIALEDDATINYDKKRISKGDTEYSFSGAKFLNYDSLEDEVKVLSKGWKALIDDTDDNKEVQDITNLDNAIVVVDDDDDVLLVYSKVNTTIASDDVFAVVTNIDHKDTGKETVTFKTVNNEEVVYEAGTTDLLETAGIEVADFVIFTVNNDKIETITKLFDVIAMNDLDSKVAINTSSASLVDTSAKLDDNSTVAILTEITTDNTTKENLTFEYNAKREDKLIYTEDVTAGTRRVPSTYINNKNLTIVDLSNMDEYCEGIEFVDSLEEIDGATVIAITINDDTDSDDEGAEILVVIK